MELSAESASVVVVSTDSSVEFLMHNLRGFVSKLMQFVKQALLRGVGNEKLFQSVAVGDDDAAIACVADGFLFRSSAGPFVW